MATPPHDEGDFPRRVGRYDVFEPFARGGMATVHLGRLVGDRGFSRLVAVKMLARERAAASSAYARALEEEARVASRIRHPNVAAPLDVVEDGRDLLLVMEYVHGVSLAELLEASREVGETLPEDVVVKVVVDALEGLHAAHEAVDELGRPIGIVHRDVSPQNILVGADGIARLADFGVAKAMRRDEHTETGIVKGKPAYMAPEQKRGLPLTRQADLHAVGVVLAEALTGAGPADAFAAMRPGGLRDVVATATRESARDRYATAAEMAAAICDAVAPAQASEVGKIVSRLAGDALDLRADLARKVEQASASRNPPPPRVEPSRPPEPLEPETLLLPSRAPSAVVVPEPPPRRSHAKAVGLGVALLAMMAATVLIVRAPWGDRETKSASATTSASPSEPPPASAIAPAPALASASALASAWASSSASASPSASAPPESDSADPPARPPRTKPRPTSRPSAKPPDCEPPFSVGADGKRHYKPECLR